MEAFKSFNASQILRIEPNSTKVHAEMQIVDQLLLATKPLKATYIGISKLCCLSCYAALSAVNRAYENNSIEFKVSFRGFHIGQFERWDKPLFFLASGGLDKDLRIKILSEYDNIFKALQKDLKPATTFTMDHSDSESGHSQSSEDVLSDYTVLLTDRKKAFESMSISEQDSTIKAHLELTKFCFLLLNEKILDRLFFISDKTSKSEMKNIVDAFFGSLMQKHIQYTAQKLTVFFDSSYFPPVKNKSELIDTLKRNLEELKFNHLEDPKKKKAKFQKQNENTMSVLQFSASSHNAACATSLPTTGVSADENREKSRKRNRSQGSIF